MSGKREPYGEKKKPPTGNAGDAGDAMNALRRLSYAALGRAKALELEMASLRKEMRELKAAMDKLTEEREDVDDEQARMPF